MPHQPPTSVLERELQSVLIRHLPLGLEGVGLAQTQAVLALLARRNQPRPRPALLPRQREGIRLLQDAARAHAASVQQHPDASPTCGVCRRGDGTPQSWPCPVWTAADLLDVD